MTPGGCFPAIQPKSRSGSGWPAHVHSNPGPLILLRGRMSQVRGRGDSCVFWGEYALISGCAICGLPREETQFTKDKMGLTGKIIFCTQLIPGTKTSSSSRYHLDRYHEAALLPFLTHDIYIGNLTGHPRILVRAFQLPDFIKPGLIKMPQRIMLQQVHRRKMQFFFQQIGFSKP